MTDNLNKTNTMNTANPTQIHATGEATGFIPAPGDKGNPIGRCFRAQVREQRYRCELRKQIGLLSPCGNCRSSRKEMAYFAFTKHYTLPGT